MENRILPLIFICGLLFLSLAIGTSFVQSKEISSIPQSLNATSRYNVSQLFAQHPSIGRLSSTGRGAGREFITKKGIELRLGMWLIPGTTKGPKPPVRLFPLFEALFLPSWENCPRSSLKDHLSIAKCGPTTNYIFCGPCALFSPNWICQKVQQALKNVHWHLMCLLSRPRKWMAATNISSSLSTRLRLVFVAGERCHEGQVGMTPCTQELSFLKVPCALARSNCSHSRWMWTCRHGGHRGDKKKRGRKEENGVGAWIRLREDLALPSCPLALPPWLLGRAEEAKGRYWQEVEGEKEQIKVSTSPSTFTEYSSCFSLLFLCFMPQKIRLIWSIPRRSLRLLALGWA